MHAITAARIRCAGLAIAACGLMAQTALAQYIDKAIVRCTPTYVSLQVADDDPGHAYVEVRPKYDFPQLLRLNLTTGASTVLRTFSTTYEPEYGWTAFSLVAKNGAEIYATDADDTKPGRYAIYRSVDRGVSWQKVVGDAGGCRPGVRASPDGGTVSYLTGCGGAGISFDHGGTWGGGSIPGFAEQVAYSANHPKVIYAITTAQGRRSVDGGRTWTPMALRGYRANLGISLQADGVDPMVVYARTSGNAGTFFQYSRNGGDDWIVVPGTATNSQFQPRPDATGVLYEVRYNGATATYFRSIDYGQTWIALVENPAIDHSCMNSGLIVVGPASNHATPLYLRAYGGVLYDSVRSVPGVAAIATNTYGAPSVTGATLVGNTITNFGPGAATVMLGNLPGAPGSAMELDFDGLNVGSGNSLTVRSGAAGQTVVLRNLDGAPSTFAGVVRAESGSGAPPPALVLQNVNGVDVATTGEIIASSGLTVSAVDTSWRQGQTVRNAGVIDGGPSLSVRAAGVGGNGAFHGDAITLSTFGNANNPANGAHFLSNGLQLFPSNGNSIALALNAYGSVPQFINVQLRGNAYVAMPSAWAAGSVLPPNNAVLDLTAIRPANQGDPGYGGGSIILAATGTMTLVPGANNDFVFPGGVVLMAETGLDINDVRVNQGWTTTGRAFQGVFFESPHITSRNGIDVLSNDQNWTNFSTVPQAPVRSYVLRKQADGSASYVSADAFAPHLNTFSIITEAAANGQCWTCLLNTSPVDMR